MSTDTQQNPSLLTMQSMGSMGLASLTSDSRKRILEAQVLVSFNPILHFIDRIIYDV